MSTIDPPAWRFVAADEAETESLPGRTHFWHGKPGMVAGTNLLCVRVEMQPGHAHTFHKHPHMEEILYFISGQGEQWIGRNTRSVGPGDSAYIPADMVHGTYNTGLGVLEFLAILTPANNPGPATVELADQEPWKSWRP